MKKKILLSLIIFVGLFMITGCGVVNNGKPSDNGKTYNVNGVSVKLDKEDDIHAIKFKTSSSFERKFSTSNISYTIYKDENGDKYDLSNLAFRIDVTVDSMNSTSKIEIEKEKIKKNGDATNIQQEEKKINDVVWDYFTYDNVSENDQNFKQHLYIVERKEDNYYYIYKVYFSYAEDIAEFEEAFMNSISFE